MKLIIGASKNNLIGSKLIRLWMNTPYSHVYCRWYLNTQEREIVYQASRGLVHFQCFENFKIDNEIIDEIQIELTNEQFRKFSTKCIDLAGQSYSCITLLQILLCELSGGRVKFEDQPGYICSELMCELLEDLGYKFNKPKFLVTPKDIIESLRTQNA
jgi:hypothetical protein